jgi:2-oxoglutarate ferredoxin oxidoreductase subunit alpha
MMRLKTLWPFAAEEVEQVSRSAKRIFVPEMNMGQVAGEVMKYAACEVVTYNQTNGEIISPRTIEREMRRSI